MISNMKEWHPEEGTKIYVFNLNVHDTKPIRQYTAPPLFAYHHINAYETKDEIVMDVTGEFTAL